MIKWTRLMQTLRCLVGAHTWFDPMLFPGGVIVSADEIHRYMRDHTLLACNCGATKWTRR